MMRVKVMVKNNQKTIKVPVGIRMLIRRCCQAVLVMEQFPHDAEVSVSFVSNAEIRNLNRIYRKKDSVTDVLSFPLGVDGKYDISKETGCALLGEWSSLWKPLCGRQICTDIPSNGKLVF